MGLHFTKQTEDIEIPKFEVVSVSDAQYLMSFSVLLFMSMRPEWLAG